MSSFQVQYIYLNHFALMAMGIGINLLLCFTTMVFFRTIIKPFISGVILVSPFFLLYSNGNTVDPPYLLPFFPCFHFNPFLHCAGWILN